MTKLETWLTTITAATLTTGILGLASTVSAQYCQYQYVYVCNSYGYCHYVYQWVCM